MKTVLVDSFEDFEELTATPTLEICQEIVKALTKGIDKKRKKVKVFELSIKSDPGAVYDFSIERGEWLKALTTCLDMYTQEELFEECIQIQSLIKTLEDEIQSQVSK